MRQSRRLHILHGVGRGKFADLLVAFPALFDLGPPVAHRQRIGLALTDEGRIGRERCAMMFVDRPFVGSEVGLVLRLIGIILRLGHGIGGVCRYGGAIDLIVEISGNRHLARVGGDMGGIGLFCLRRRWRCERGDGDERG